MNEIGQIRPSQLIFTFGIASLIDLPNMSGLVMGLDDWNTQYCREITEDRLLAAIKKRMGAQVARLYLPPIKLDETQNDPGAPAIGVPVVPFPRWMRCPYCDTLSTVDSGVFKLSQDQWRPDRTEYRHEGCTKARGKVTPGALSVRFLLACREGHLTDFPWIEFVHNKTVACKPAQLTLREYGISGDASDIIVKCLSCNTERRMADAFDQDTHFKCPGHHPHLRRFDTEQCEEDAKTILLGASNSWFSVSLSALSIPQATDRLAKLVEENWEEIKNVDSENELLFYRKNVQKFQALIPLFSDFKDSQIWNEIEAKRASSQEVDDTTPDIKLPEWQVFSNPDSATESKDFKLRKVAPPKGFEQSFENTVLVERHSRGSRAAWIHPAGVKLRFRRDHSVGRCENQSDFTHASHLDTSFGSPRRRHLSASERRRRAGLGRPKRSTRLASGFSGFSQALETTSQPAAGGRRLSGNSFRTPSLSGPCTHKADRFGLRLHISQSA